MNVFYIPSWYPDPDRRLIEGIFFYEMAVALAEHHPEVTLFVSLWGQSHLEISTWRLRSWLRYPGLGLPPRAPRRALRANLVELFRPAWTWRHQVRRGNIDAILRVNRAHFTAATAECGRIDLIHAQVSFPAGYLAMRLATEHGIPYLVSEHMGQFRQFERDGALVPEVVEPLRGAARVTAVSRALADQIRHKTGVQPVVVPNGIDGAFFSPGPKTSRDFVFLTVAALVPGKGLDELLRSIARLGPRPDVRFRIAGAGSHEPVFRILAARLGIEDRVEWLGPLDRTQVRDAMRDCDCFVLTSRRESFGVVYAEALACGKPVIATRCGGPEDIVNERNGMLVPVGDIEAIAAALGAMIAEAGRYDVEAIRADFEARFTSRLVSDLYMTLYRDLVGVP